MQKETFVITIELVDNQVKATTLKRKETGRMVAVDDKHYNRIANLMQECALHIQAKNRFADEDTRNTWLFRAGFGFGVQKFVHGQRVRLANGTIGTIFGINLAKGSFTGLTDVGQAFDLDEEEIEALNPGQLDFLDFQP